MSSLITTLIVLLCLYLLIQLILLCSILFTPDDVPVKKHTDEELPAISVLVAARNEEANIVRCLTALDQLYYPAAKIRILVGNDHSEDRTRELVAAYIEGNHKFTLVDIDKPLGKARGKANVLAQLAHRATGDLYLITDADISVNPYWAYELAQYFENNRMGIVSGITIVEEPGMMGRLQQIDWMYFMGLLKSFANLGLHCTAVGNNMAVSRQAYWGTGGYENLDFSITEDYKLYKEVRKKGWNTQNILSIRSVNRSAAITGIADLLHQRKRWLMGAKELPLYWWLFFGLYGLFLPCVVVLMFYNLELALLFYAVKILLQSASISVLQRRMQVVQHAGYTLLYELYTNIVSLATQVFFVLPVKLTWKKRTYTL